MFLNAWRKEADDEGIQDGHVAKAWPGSKRNKSHHSMIADCSAKGVSATQSHCNANSARTCADASRQEALLDAKDADAQRFC